MTGTEPTGTEHVGAPGSTAAAPRTPLLAIHEAAGAQLIDFAGWQMPVRYSSDLAEHHAVRSQAGLFDISHMAEIAVTGEGAGAFLDHALAGRLSALAEPLRETAAARRRMPDADLDTLATALGVSRSAVNHRLRRLVELANDEED